MSLLARQYAEELNQLGQSSDITLTCIPVYRDYFGNEHANELARLGSALNITKTELIDIPLGVIRNNILKHLVLKSENKWRSLDICTIAKITWTFYNMKSSMQLLSHSSKNIRDYCQY